ncbi:hypothetical protein PC112_g25685 [Phytophthora cactorum]|nr:hypothetical protein PC112_g25685 [Phytophthora cactorum]
MLHHAKLDKCFWAEAAMTAIYVKNLMEGMDPGHRSLDEAKGGSTLGETGVETGNHLRGRGKIRK